MSTELERGASSPQMMRRANRQILLQYALTVPSFTAADAMAATGLTRATVLGVSAEVEQAGLLTSLAAGAAGAARATGAAIAAGAGATAGERSGRSASRGRPARRFALRADAAVLVGIDAGQHTLRARAVDLRGRELASAIEPADPVGPTGPTGPTGLTAPARLSAAESRIAQLRALIARVAREATSAHRAPTNGAPADGAPAEAMAADATSAGATRTPLLTVVGVPAPVRADGRSPVGGNDFWTTMNPDLVDALAGDDLAGQPAAGRVIVENDANLAALAALAERGDTQHLAALLMGERFGAGLVIDGRLLRGADGGAGEMRFLDDVLDDSRGADGVAALARRWALEGLSAGQDAPLLAAVPAEELTAVTVLEAAERGDPLARAVRERLALRLARIAGILASLLGAERVVVAGAIAESIGPVLERSRKLLPEVATAPFPQLVASTDGRDVVVRGATELALACVREAPLDLLMPDA